MTVSTELSEAHLQDHELISAALEASSISPRPSSSILPSFINSAPERERLVTESQHKEATTRASASSPTQQEEDLLTTPRTDSSRPLSSPPNLAQLSSTDAEKDRNTVKFTLLKKNGPSEQAGEQNEGEDGTAEDLEEQAEGASAQGDEAGEPTTESGESSELDPVLLAALNHHRDRFLLLRAEVELERFLANPSMTRLPLAPPYFQPALNSYQRLLVHRLADTFGITREVEAAPPTVWNAGAINPATGQPQGVVVLVKGENTRLPPAKLATYAPAPEVPTPIVPSSIAVPSPSSTPSIASSPVTSAGPSASTSSLPNLVDPSTAPSQQPTTLQILKILPRSGASRTTSSASSSIGTDDDPATSSSAPASAKGKGRRELTLEEREAAYKEARERIFSQPEQERTAPTLPASSSSVASEEMSVRIGAGITRPSSAGSTFSRSSAALSVTGSRPSPSVASESGSSMWSGHHGGIYGGGSQLLPSLRPSAPSFDPNLVGWTPPPHEYQGGGQYHQQDPYQQYHHQVQYAQPPIQVTAPPTNHSPYIASSPSYASSSSSSISGPVPPHHFPPPQHQQHQYGQLNAWGRNVPPPLPSPSLSNSSGNSMQRPPPPPLTTSNSERSASGSSGVSGVSGGGYLMRFADSGNVVSPIGGVASPSSSIMVGPPSTTRSVSSFSSTSQLSGGSSSASGGGGGGTSSRNAASSSNGGTGGGSRTGNVGGGQGRRASGSLASSVGSLRSGERKVSREGEVDGTTESKKGRERQTTIRRQSPQQSIEQTEKEAEETSSSLHPSLPPKPVWVASKPPRPRSPPLPVAASSSSSRDVPPSTAFSSSSSSPSVQFPPPPPSFIDSASSSRPPQQIPYPFPSGPPPSNFYHPSSSQPPAFSQGPPIPPPSNWNRPTPPPTGLHYPAAVNAPSYSSILPQQQQGQYPIASSSGGGNYLPSQQPPQWSYAHPPLPPTAPQIASMPPQARTGDGSMPFTDIRRPPPKSTQLFDPNRPGGGSMGASGTGMRRGVSGTGPTR
ncbi:uncharacterized protein JCM6883_002303 [Sporobolomyces salmoneus]|uniref:uncharacterized protein n=1 Tax=Sporobolomyces salmoneus TaxID=183962 RepID=UPI003180B6AB